jgi:WD40 repeat protein
VQLWTVTPNGHAAPVTTGCQSVGSSFTWHPDGDRIACVMGGRVCVIDTTSGAVHPLTEASDHPPRPEACVFSPDGRRAAFVRTIGGVNQVCVADVG